MPTHKPTGRYGDWQRTLITGHRTLNSVTGQHVTRGFSAGRRHVSGGDGDDDESEQRAALTVA